mgnify:CR=1 FL=1
MKKEYIVNNNKYIFDGENLELYLIDSNFETELNNEKNNKNEKLLNKSKNKLINKIVFNVSNMCNLNCKYCYANGGNYNREDSLMSLNTAKIIINEIKLKYDDIGTVYFFGGEPLLNFELIKHIVNELEKYYREKIDFRIVTNGILLNEEKIKFLDKHNFKLYISLDGPKEVQEFLRGANTFDKIISNINIIKKYSLKERTELLCTYTKKHEEMLGYDKIVDFFESLNLKYSITDVITNDEELKVVTVNQNDRQRKYIDISIERIFNLSKNTGISEYLSAILNALVFHSKQEVFCKELNNDYSNVFDYSGDEYNCIRLVGKFKKDDDEIKKNNLKANHKVCQKCIFKNLCTMCIADKLLKNEKFPFDNKNCRSIELYSYALRRVIEIYNESEEKMVILLNNYYSNYLK